MSTLAYQDLLEAAITRWGEPTERAFTWAEWRPDHAVSFRVQGGLRDPSLLVQYYRDSTLITFDRWEPILASGEEWMRVKKGRLPGQPRT